MKGCHRPGHPGVRLQRFDRSVVDDHLAGTSNRCLVPANSFSEYAPDPNTPTKKNDVVWFALNDDRPLIAFAGIWTEFKGDRGGTKFKMMLAVTRSTVS